MSRTLTASDRKRLIKLASTMPAGSEERKVILAGLSKAAKSMDRMEYLDVTGKNWDGYTDEEVGLKSAARRVAARYSRAASAGHLKVEEYIGKKGRKDHITRYEKGTIPTKEALTLNPPIRHHGRRKWHMRDGERYFGNYSEERWNALLEDIRKNGIKTDLWIKADPGKEAELMEGNHRVQAAAQIGLPTVPVNIQYYGLREEDGLVAPQVRRTTIHQDEERRR